MRLDCKNGQDSLTSLNTGEGLKGMTRTAAAIAAVAGLCVFAPQAEAELVPEGMPIDDETGVYKLTLTDEEHKSANSIVLYEVDKTANPWTVTPQYYDLTLNKTEYNYQTGGTTLTYSIKAPYDNVTVTASYTSQGSRSGDFELLEDVLIAGYTTGVGGAVAVYGESGTIKDSVFIDNRATSYGGGALYNKGSIAKITGSTFIGNTTSNQGGAFYNLNYVGDIDNCTFIANNAPMGGAIFNYYGYIDKIKNSSFIGNTGTNGGAILNGEQVGTISGNLFLGNSGNAAGAIYNYSNAYTDSINDNWFVGNSSNNYGGAIYNGSNATILHVNGNKFIGNTSSLGGALRNNSSITDITNNIFINNTASSTGGAIYGYMYSSTANMSNNIFINNNAKKGGAIYTNLAANIANMSNNIFINNNANESGGAIYRSLMVDMEILCDNQFIGNNANKYGGALYNTGYTTDINILDSNFINNSAGLLGGAIYSFAQYNNSTMNIVSQESDVLFAGNTANGVSNAIYNTSVGQFMLGVENGMNAAAIGVQKYRDTLTALQDMYAAVADGDRDTAIAKYNFAKDALNYIYSNTPRGIYNNVATVIGDIGETEAKDSVTNLSTATNTLTSSYSTLRSSRGIYNTEAEDFLDDATKMSNLQTTLNQLLSSYDANNEAYLDALASAEAAINAITQPLPEDHVRYAYTSEINMNAAEDYKIVFNDGIDGGDYNTPFEGSETYYAGKGVININKEIENLPSGGTVVFNETVQNNDLNVYAGTLHLGNRDNVIDGLDVTMYGGLLNTINNQTGTVALNTLTLQNDFNMAVDVDLANEKMDRLTANNYNLNDHKVNVVGMNLISDATKNDTTILFADNELKNSVNNMVDEAGLGVDTLYQTTAYSPLYKYTVKYQVKDNGGYYNFSGGPSGGDFNPAVLTTGVVQQANVLAVQNVVNNYAFSAVDNSAINPRLGSRFDNRYALGNDQLIKDDLNTNNPLFVKPDQESVWVKPFVTFENIPLRNGPKVNSTTYGTLIGYDSNPKYYKRGFEGVWSGYIGYTGSNIHYSGVDSTSNGGLLGTTFSLYKGNFFNATTLTAGAMLDQASTMYGKDNITTLYAGVGNKVGYNLRFKEDLFVLQPSLLLSYTFGNTFDYTNAAGVRINSDPIHSIQISPGVKFYMNTKSGWQPYLGVNMMWNIMDQTHVRANGVKLPEMSIKPYVQYGIGVQKTVKDHFTAYGQAMIQNGGRNGISLTMGFKWALGKNKNKIQKVQNPDKKVIKKVQNDKLFGIFHKAKNEHNGIKHTLKG